MAKMLREPLLYFLLLGGAMFILFEQVSDQTFLGAAQPEIVVSEGQIQALLLNFEKVWQRSPSSEESEGLIRNHIREEVLYREALAMGLDKDDAIIRRRLRQKIEFLSEDIASLNELTEQELQA